MIRKISLTAKFVTSKPDLQIIAVHILSNISQSKENQTIKFGQLTKHSKKKIFFKNYAENEAGRLAPDLFYFLKKNNMR